MFNMITRIYESKTISKHIFCKCKCKFDGRKCDSDKQWNNNKCCCECRKRHVYEKDYIWNPVTCSYENGKCLASIMNDSAIICDEVIDADADAEAKLSDETKTVSPNFNKKETNCKMQRFFILLAPLLVTIALFMAVSILLLSGKILSKTKTFITTLIQKQHIKRSYMLKIRINNE